MIHGPYNIELPFLNKQVFKTFHNSKIEHIRKVLPIWSTFKTSAERMQFLSEVNLM